MNDMISEYARLSIAAEKAQRTGHPVPAHIVHRMQVIEATAKTRLNPAMLEAAMHHVEAAKMRILAEAEASARERETAATKEEADKLARSLTQGWLGKAEGLTADEFYAVRDGRAVTFRSARPPQARVDDMFRARTGMSEAEYLAQMDQLAEGSDRDLYEAAAKLHVDPSRLRERVQEWKDGGAIEYGLRKRLAGEGREDETAKPDPALQRRAQVVSAILKQSADRNDPDLIPNGNRISEESLRDTSSRGAVARAFEAHDRGIEVSEVEAEVAVSGTDS